MHIKSITELGQVELKGKRVLVRVDFNVQVYEGKILDDLRVRKTLPTIKFLRDAGAKIILISHIESKDDTGLRPVADYISAHYAAECGEVKFVENFLSESSREVCSATNENFKNGQVVLFENLRTSEGEKANDPEFAKHLASFADIYVNDAFAVSHRAHASVVGVPALFPNARFAGIQLGLELENLKTAFNPPHPFIFILGGAKFETKLPLIEKFSKTADYLYLGGALLNDILKAKGFSVGKSLVSSGSVDVSAAASNPKVIIPDDVIVERAGEKMAVALDDVCDDDMIMDVGPSFTQKLLEHIASAKFVLWNGPMGNYEKGYKEQTVSMARVIAESSAQSLIGGGDTTAAIAELGFDAVKDGKGNTSHMFVSTGGGAMLEYLENETLPGVEALA